MDQDIRDLLFETVDQVFEKMFFTFLDLEDEVHAQADRNVPLSMEAFINVASENSGAVSFYFTDALARHIAMNFLGIGEEVLEEKQIEDVVGETANMTVGSLLGKLDSQVVCGALGIPEVRKLSGVCLADIRSQSDNTLVFKSEHGWLVMEFGALAMCFENRIESDECDLTKW